MAVIADQCPDVQVTVVDINQTRINAWNDGDLSKLPVYEPGLDAAVQAPLDAAWPVINACKVDAAARDVSTKAGYGELFVLRTGLSL